MKKNVERISRFRGLECKEGFLSRPQCENLLVSIGEFRKKYSLPEILRPEKGRSLHYFVIDGEAVKHHLPALEALALQIRVLAEQVSGLPLGLLEDKKVAVNVNITPPAGEYRWHYDRNAITAILFLNEVQGGETEIYPGYRLHLRRRKHGPLQRTFDRLLQSSWVRRLFGKRVLIRPQTGLLLIMRGDYCLHSVRKVEGIKERINIIFSYDLPGTFFPQQEGLNSYLYTQETKKSWDPNYLTRNSAR
jgi:hypothetical protein